VPACRLLQQYLKDCAGAVFGRSLDHDRAVVAFDPGIGALEVETRPHFPAGLVEGVGQLMRVVLGDDVEGELLRQRAPLAQYAVQTGYEGHDAKRDDEQRTYSKEERDADLRSVDGLVAGAKLVR